MPKWLTITMQTVATIGQVVNAYGGLIPPEYHAQIATGLGVAQLVITNIAHNYNPDGTSAKTTFVPKVKKVKSKVE